MLCIIRMVVCMYEFLFFKGKCNYQKKKRAITFFKKINVGAWARIAIKTNSSVPGGA